MMNSVRRIRHGLIYRSVTDPIPNGQRASTFDFETLSDPMLISKALVSAVLLAYPAIALESPSDIKGESHIPRGLRSQGSQSAAILTVPTTVRPRPL